MVRTKIGEATVLRVFDIKKVGVIAGAVVRDGRFTREGTLVIWRGKTKVGEGKISSLQRDKKSVKEVQTGFECAFMVHNFVDWQEDDRVECFIDIPKK
jgi:translation initiation factor IF-2